MKHARWMGIGLSLSFVLLSARAIAVPTAGRVRLSLEGQVIGYESVSVTPTNSASSTTSTVFSGGIVAPGLGIGIGAGIGDNLLLGGRLMVASQKTTLADDASETSQTQVTVRANPEYVFDGHALRPFLAGSIGYAYSTANAESGQVSTNAGLFGGGFGLHYFVTDSFSIDPGMFAYYETGHLSTQVTNTASITSSTYDVGAQVTGFSFVFGVSLSGWLGGHEQKEHDASELSPESAALAAGPSTPVAAPVDDPNELHAMVKLSGGDRAIFRTNPSKSVEVDMAVIVAHEDAALARCSALFATSSKGRTSYGPFRAQRLGAGTEAALSLTTKTTVGSLDGLMSDGDMVTLEGCGQSWSVYPVQTASLRLLVNTARGHAPEHAAPAVPPAPSAEQTAPEQDATAVPGVGAPQAPLAPAQQEPTQQQQPSLSPQAPAPPQAPPPR